MSKRQKPVRPAAASNSATSSVSLENDIRFRAFELYQQRGGKELHDVDDWLQAEKEIRNRTNRKAA